MNELHFKILNSCSGKSYKAIVETFGKESVDYLIQQNLIVRLNNNILTRTEEGVNMSKPLDVRENIYKDLKDFNPINDSGVNVSSTDKPLYS